MPEHPATTAQDIRAALGRRIRAHRQDVCITQHTLAERVGTAQVVISRFEAGQRNIPILRLVKIGQALGVSPATLLAEALCETAPETVNEQVDAHLARENRALRGAIARATGCLNAVDAETGEDRRDHSHGANGAGQPSSAEEVEV